MHHEVVPSLGHVVEDFLKLAEPHECLLPRLGVRCQKVATKLLDHLGVLSLTTISEIVVGNVGMVRKFYLSELPYMVWDVQSVDPLFNDRELIPPITPFLEEDLKLPSIGCTVTPENVVGPKPLFRTPGQKLPVLKPRCHLVIRLMSRI